MDPNMAAYAQMGYDMSGYGQQYGQQSQYAQQQQPQSAWGGGMDTGSLGYYGQAQAAPAMGGAAGGGSRVKIRGLPYQVTVHEIVEFFHGYGITRESINLGTTPDGRPSGEAWVTFPDMETGQVAVREKNRKHIGSRYVELFME